MPDGLARILTSTDASPFDSDRLLLVAEMLSSGEIEKLWSEQSQKQQSELTAQQVETYRQTLQSVQKAIHQAQADAMLSPDAAIGLAGLLTSTNAMLQSLNLYQGKATQTRTVQQSARMYEDTLSKTLLKTDGLTRQTLRASMQELRTTNLATANIKTSVVHSMTPRAGNVAFGLQSSLQTSLSNVQAGITSTGAIFSPATPISSATATLASVAPATMTTVQTTAGASAPAATVAAVTTNSITGATTTYTTTAPSVTTTQTTPAGVVTTIVQAGPQQTVSLNAPQQQAPVTSAVQQNAPATPVAQALQQNAQTPTAQASTSNVVFLPGVTAPAAQTPTAQAAQQVQVAAVQQTIAVQAQQQVQTQQQQVQQQVQVQVQQQEAKLVDAKIDRAVEATDAYKSDSNDRWKVKGDTNDVEDRQERKVAYIEARKSDDNYDDRKVLIASNDVEADDRLASKKTSYATNETPFLMADTGQRTEATTLFTPTETSKAPTEDKTPTAGNDNDVKKEFKVAAKAGCANCSGGNCALCRGDITPQKDAAINAFLNNG